MEEFRPSLEKVFKDLDGFTYETKMYVYHKLNGRDEEAETYLNTYKYEQKLMMEELKPCDTSQLKPSSNDNNEEVLENQDK